MSIYGALRSGVSGLFVQSQALGMISDNIANVNTVGYKTSNARFATLVTNASSRNFYSPGGVSSTVGRDIDRQGLLQASSTSTDLGISGSGFFAVTDQVSFNTTTGRYEPSGNIYFTRAGQFRPDEQGNLVNSAGYFLLGYPPNATGTAFQVTNVLTNLNAVNVAASSSPPIATTEGSVSANLNTTAATGDTYTVSLQIFDRQGTTKTVGLTFTKVDPAISPNTWDISATLTGGGQFWDGAALAGTTVANMGSVTFNADGTLGNFSASNSAAVASTVAADPNGATGSQVLRFTLDHDATVGTTADQVTLDLTFGTVANSDGLTQFDSPSVVNTVSQNGKQSGSLSAVTSNEEGVITALFDNGEQRELFQVPVITFNNPNGLQPRTGNVYLQTDQSGNPVAKISGTGGAGLVAPSALEASTTDIADEFTNLIITQRAYSANTRIITTADELLDELIRIKR